ncbi:hypothetical protein B484DRAFT_35122, partial [Ochromonadaceae sp. CCMP2298]
MQYGQTEKILEYEISCSAQRTQKLVMTMKPGAKGRSAMAAKQYWGTISDFTDQQGDGTFPLLVEFMSDKKNVAVTVKTFSENWLPKLHAVIAQFETVPAPEPDDYSPAELSDDRLEEWAHRLEAFDPIKELGIVQQGVVNQAKLTSGSQQAAERRLKLQLISLMHSVHLVHTRAPRNDVDRTWKQVEADEMRKAQGKARTEGEAVDKSKVGKKRTIPEKQADLGQVRKAVRGARNDQRIGGDDDLHSDDEGPDPDHGSSSSSATPAATANPGRQRKKAQTVLNDGLGALDRLSSSLDAKNSIASKNQDKQALN